MSTIFRRQLLASAILSATLSSAFAGFAPAPGVQTRTVFDSASAFNIVGGLALENGRLYTGLGTSVLALNPDDGAAPVAVGTLPFNFTVAFVERALGQTYAAWSASFSFPFPYALGVNESGAFGALLSADAIYDGAVSPLGELYVVAAPGGSDTHIYRFQPATTSLVDVVHPGGYSGGIAFDRSGRLYYADQNSRQIWRFTPAQLALGSLGPAQAEIVVDNVGASYLTLDNRDRLYAATGFGNALRIFDGATGAERPLLAEDDAFGYGLGKMVWDRTANRLFATYTDFGTFSSRLLEVLPPAVAGDADRDGAADLRVYHAASGTWYVLGSDGSRSSVVSWGGRGATPVSGDFDGDARVDTAFYTARSGTWSILNSRDGSQRMEQWGWPEATPVAGDYDGDGRTDPAVYHPASGNWHILRSSDGQGRVINWGWSAAVPVPADYDGDRVTDLAVYHPAQGTWYVLLSRTGATVVRHLGITGGDPVPADYDGDGRAELALYQRRTGLWTFATLAGEPSQLSFGWRAAVGVPGDYDGDGKADPAVYHQAAGNWYVLGSRDGYRVQNWGWKDAQAVRP